MERVNKAIYSKLRETLPEEVDIWPGIADIDASLPLCVFNMDSFTVKRVKEGIYTYEFEYSVLVFSPLFDKADEYATLVAKAMNTAVLGDEIRSYLTGGRADFQEDAFVQELNFNIRSREDTGDGG